MSQQPDECHVAGVQLKYSWKTIPTLPLWRAAPPHMAGRNMGKQAPSASVAFMR